MLDQSIIIPFNWLPSLTIKVNLTMNIYTKTKWISFDSLLKQSKTTNLYGH